MTAYDDIRAATTAAEVEHGVTLDELADAQDTIAAQSNEIEELKKALAECEGGTDPDPPPTGDLSPILVPPAGKLLLGVQQEQSGWTGWLAEAGQAPHIYHRYANSAANVLTILNATPVGTIPLMNYKPAGQMGLTAYNSILAGNQNTSIDQTADHIKNYGKPMFLAPMHEPENDGPATDDDEYARAFRYIIERIRARGVTNVVSVWNMMGFNGHGARYPTLYPGDDVVDWIGYDPYVRTTTSVDTWAEFLNLGAGGGFPGMYAWAAPKGKPIMLCEWGLGSPVVPAVPTSMFGNTQMAALLRDFPLLKALVYWSAVGEQDYRVTHPNWGSTILPAWVRRTEFVVDISKVAK